METQTQAQIYLADQRGESATHMVQSRHTFNFGHYQAEGRKPFGALTLLNDDTLRAGASLTMTVEQPIKVVVLPVVGGLEYTVAEATCFLEPGQAGVLSLAAGMTYSISNPYETEFINCIQLWLTHTLAGASPASSPAEFNLSRQNALLPIMGIETAPLAGHQIFIGRYAGRQEGSYPVQPAADGQSRLVFVFVLQGVFEIANRLVQERDGLALTFSEAEIIEFEALSNDALLILIDLVE